MSGRFSGQFARAMLVLIALGCGYAHAHLPAPPVRRLVDENGVDLMSGNWSQSDIDIGPPEANLARGRIATTAVVISHVGLRALSMLDPDGTLTEFGNKVWYPFPRQRFRT
jgi:hypothetical protein